MPEATILQTTRRRRIAVATLMVLAVVHSIVWAVILPPWQGADENLRYAALQAVAHDRWGVPLIDSTAVVDSVQAPGKPVTDSVLLYRSVGGAMPWIVPGYRESFSLAYELAAPVYALLAAPLGPWMPYLVRLIASLFVALVVFATYRTAATIWPDRPILALAAGAIPALLPAAAAAHATVLPDAVGNALAAGALALLVAIASKGASPLRVAVAAGLVLAAVLTKQTTLYLVPLAIGAAPIAWAAARPDRLRWRRRLVIGVAVGLLVIAVVVAAFSVREVGQKSFGSVQLGQFLTPGLWVRAFAPMFDVFSPPLIVRSFWGGIGWFQGFFPKGVEVVLAIAGWLIWIAAIAVMMRPELRARAGLDRRRMAGLALLLLSAFAVMGQALIRDVLSQESGIVRNAAQGRWLFAAMPAFAVIAALAIGGWQRREHDLWTLGAFVAGLGTLSGALVFAVTVPYFYVIFPDVIREHRLFFGRLVPVRRGVMILSATRPEPLATKAAAGTAIAVWLAAVVAFLSSAWDCAMAAGEGGVASKPPPPLVATKKITGGAGKTRAGAKRTTGAAGKKGGAGTTLARARKTTGDAGTAPARAREATGEAGATADSAKDATAEAETTNGATETTGHADKTGSASPDPSRGSASGSSAARGRAGSKARRRRSGGRPRS